MINHPAIIASLATTFAAIIAPTITILIHSVKEYKIAKMNHTIDERLKLCEKFSKSYSNCQYGPNKIGFMNSFYHDALLLAAVCKHRSTRRYVFTLANKVLKHGASESTDKLYEHCIQLLSKEF